MQKMFLFFAIFLSFNSFAGVVETCRDGKFPAGDETNWYWIDSDIRIIVRKDADYTAEIKFNSRVENVVEGIEVKRLQQFDSAFTSMLKLIRVNSEDIDHGIYYDFHPAANQDDMSGFSLLVVKSKTGATLAKVFQAGWGLGICK